MAAHVADDAAVKTSFGKCRQSFFGDSGRQHGIDIYIGIRRVFVIVDHDIMRLHEVIKIQDCHPEFPEFFLRQPLFQIIQDPRRFLLLKLFHQLTGIKLSGLAVINQVPAVPINGIASPDDIAPIVSKQWLFRLDKAFLQMELAQLIRSVPVRQKFFYGRQTGRNQSLFLAFGIHFRHTSAKQRHGEQDQDHPCYRVFTDNLHHLSLFCHPHGRQGPAPSR